MKNENSILKVASILITTLGLTVLIHEKYKKKN